jgi:hypothetical protein
MGGLRGAGPVLPIRRATKLSASLGRGAIFKWRGLQKLSPGPFQEGIDTTVGTDPGWDGLGLVYFFALVFDHYHRPLTESSPAPEAERGVKQCPDFPLCPPYSHFTCGRVGLLGGTWCNSKEQKHTDR